MMRAVTLARIALRMRRGLPTFVSFNVTDRCTQACPMCAVRSATGSELQLPEIERIFASLRSAGFAVVEVSGGEPFLRPDLFDILAILDRLGFVYTLSTNGTLLTAESARRLDGRRGLLQLAVSLDSLDRATYAELRGADSLPRVLESLEMLAGGRHRFPVKLNVTVSRYNTDELPAIVLFAREHGFGVSAFPVVQGAGFAHRSNDRRFDASPAELAATAAMFRTLAHLRRSGEPLWEYSGYYEVAADYVEGRAPALCDAGRVFFDLRSDGGLAPCVDLPAFASLLHEPVEQALARVSDQRERLDACARDTACCYTCTANISETARHPLRFAAESALVRLRTMRRGLEW